MMLTNEIRNRITRFQNDTKTSLAEIHRALEARGHEITYTTLSQFVNGHTETTGKNLNKIDEYLKERNY